MGGTASLEMSAAESGAAVLSDWSRLELPSLPRPLTALVGRRAEIAAVTALLRRAEVGLVTLTGPGGVGKTRLAIQVAEALAAELPDGTAFVDLTSVRDPALVLPTIATVVGVRQIPGRAALDVLTDALCNRRMLLVLDNMEQVVEAGPEIARLMEGCPGLTLLVTSRVPLHIRAEQEYPLTALSMPLPGERSPDVIAESEAVALFVQRARYVRGDFALTDTTAPIVAELCRRLDGLPLAIELAAARVKVLAPSALLSRISHRLDLLSGGPRDLPARHQTMRATIAWSHDLLTPDEQVLFRRLGVFAGGFSVSAAEAVVGDPGDAGIDVFEGLASLVEKSLLRPVEEPGDDARFQMLETVREYAVEQLVAHGEEAGMRTAHTAAVLRTIATARPGLEGPGRLSVIDRVDREQDNVRAALDWAIERGDAETAQRLASEMARFWVVLGAIAEGRTWLDRAVALTGSSAPSTRSVALYWAADFAVFQDDLRRAEALTAEAMTISRAAGDRLGEALALRQYAVIHQCRGEFDAAWPLLDAALAMMATLNERVWQGVLLRDLGIVATQRGDHDGARAKHQAALALWRELQHPWGIPAALRDLADEALTRGDVATASASYRESLECWRHLREKIHLGGCFLGAARVAAETGQPERAARLLGLTEAFHEALGLVLPPDQRAHMERAAGRARSALGEARFREAWDTGRGLSLEAALAEAIQAASMPGGDVAQTRPSAPEPITVDRHGLTEREVEVLRLLADGRSNQQIAEELFISPRTASTHLSNIFGKLGVDSRSSAVSAAFKLGLV